MFETRNKHIFIAPHDSTDDNSVVKFYGNKLSLTSKVILSNVNNQVYHQLDYNGAFSSYQLVATNDHKIYTYQYFLRLPAERQLVSYHEASCYSEAKGYYYENLGGNIDVLGSKKINELGPYTLQFGQGFRVISQIDVEHHDIKARTSRLVMPSETQLSIDKKSTTGVYLNPLQHGQNFTVLSNITVNGHSIKTDYMTYSLAESYLYATDYAYFVRQNNGKYILTVSGANLCTKNESNNIILKNGANILISCGTEYNENELGNLLDAAVGKSITISAAPHTFSTSSTSNTTTISLSNANTSESREASFTITGTNGINLSQSSSGNIIISKTLQIGTGSSNGTTFNDKTTITTKNIGFGDGESIINFGTFDLAFRNSTLYKGNKINRFIIDTSHYAHGITVTSGKSQITNNSSNVANLVTWQTGTANGVGPVYDIQVVSSLPPDAKDHPNTLYLVTGGG